MDIYSETKTAMHRQNKISKKSLDSEGHLSQLPEEAFLTDFEFSLERSIHAFYRWKEACMKAVHDVEMSGHDVAVLNVLRMMDQPKSRQQLANLLNRDDTSNLQYALRKLLRAGLIEKADATSRKNTTYRTTLAGQKVTDKYADLRRQLLTNSPIQSLPSIEELKRVTAILDELSIKYSVAERLASAPRSKDS